MGIRISPSILNSDFAHLAEEINKIRNADWVHVDVMDNHFVPNLTLGAPVVESLSRVCPVPIDCHLMIEDPDRWALDFVDAGAQSVTFHAEAVTAPVRLARELRTHGARAGIAVRPATAIEPYLDILDEFDMVLIMTVEPGFGGQKYIENMRSKIARARAAAQASGSHVWVQVDGGITRETIVHAAEAGADTFVAGSAVFGAEDAYTEVQALREIALTHSHC